MYIVISFVCFIFNASRILLTSFREETVTMFSKLWCFLKHSENINYKCSVNSLLWKTWMDKLSIKSTDIEGLTWRSIGAPTYEVEII